MLCTQHCIGDTLLLFKCATLILAMPLAKWRIKLLAAVCTAVAVLLVVNLFSSIPTEETEYSTSGSTVYKDGVICPKVGYTLALSYQDQMTSAAIRMAALQCWAHPYKLYVVEPVVVSGRQFPLGMSFLKQFIHRYDIP